MTDQLTLWDAPQRAGPLLTRRAQIYEYICTYADVKDGPTPSINEISQAFHLCYSTVYYHVMKLIIEGRLRQEDGKLVVIGSDWVWPAR